MLENHTGRIKCPAGKREEDQDEDTDYLPALSVNEAYEEILKSVLA